MEEHLKEMATFQEDLRRGAKPKLYAQYRDLVANTLKKGGNPSRGLLLLRCAMLIPPSVLNDSATRIPAKRPYVSLRYGELVLGP